jgi:hypothetical protein
MRPFSDINIGDKYQRDANHKLVWEVIEKRDRLVAVQAFLNDKPYEKPIWKRPSENLFINRIFIGKTLK